MQKEVMSFIRYQFCLGLLLNVAMHLEPVMTNEDSENDSLSQKYLEKLGKSLGMLAAEIQNNLCHPCPSSLRDFNTICQNGSYLQENRKLENMPWYSWNIAFFAGGKEFMVFLGTDKSPDRRRKFRITCFERDTRVYMSTIATTGKEEELRLETTESNSVNISERTYNINKWTTRMRQHQITENSKRKTEDGRESVTVSENTSHKQEMNAVTDKTLEESFSQCWKDHRAKILRRCRKRLNCNDSAQSIYIYDDSPKFPGVGILVITHLLAAAIGCGILYLALKKFGRLINTEKKSEGNNGFNNASYSQPENTIGITIPHLTNDDDDELYHEVDGKMPVIPFDNDTKSNSFTWSASSPGRKLSKLPDIPQEPEKDEYEYLIPQTGKDLQTEKQVKYTGLITDEKVSLSGFGVHTNIDELDNSSKVAFATESKTDEYFVLEKVTDMDLK